MMNTIAMIMIIIIILLIILIIIIITIIMIIAGNRNLKRTHSLLIDDLRVYQQNHEKLKMVNKAIVKAN